MTALLLDPHGDDAVLFCCYTAIREKPHVLVTHRTVPEDEIDAAMEVLGLTWACSSTVAALEEYTQAALVIAPAREKNGHDQHNYAAKFAGWIKSERRINYLTYAPRGHRSVWGTEVVPTAREIALKLRALSCFESQIEQPSTRPWFFELLDLREWVSA